MTRDESIELAGHLHRVLAGDYRTVCAGIKHEIYTQVVFSSLTLPQKYMIDQVATERNLKLSWECQNGEDIATFRTHPVRDSFVDLAQHELDTCFEVAFGPERRFLAQLNGGVQAMQNRDESPDIETWTQMRACVGNYTLAVIVWYGTGIEIQMELDSVVSSATANLKQLFRYLKSINVDFGF